uniref:Uncharacterized protein n=1 Tax=Arundo donax TaxID=35708 RepID=A0A0A9FTQ7_ARUDO
MACWIFGLLVETLYTSMQDSSVSAFLLSHLNSMVLSHLNSVLQS